MESAGSTRTLVFIRLYGVTTHKPVISISITRREGFVFNTVIFFNWGRAVPFSPYQIDTTG
jgi:hypothetical protein